MPELQESDFHPTDDERPIAAEVRDGKVWVTLRDGRVIGTPVEWYPQLAQATPEQQANIELLPLGLHWPDLNESLSVEGMLRGSKGARWRRQREAVGSR